LEKRSRCGPVAPLPLSRFSSNEPRRLHENNRYRKTKLTKRSLTDRTGRGQAGPCLTDEAHRPFPERCSCLSRYAVARTFAAAVTAASFAGGVIMPPLLREPTEYGWP
jgi:hypothetical protein